MDQSRIPRKLGRLACLVFGKSSVTFGLWLIGRFLKKSQQPDFLSLHTRYSFNKQPSCWGSNIGNGLKVKQLAKQLPTLKALIRKIFVELWVNNLTFSILSSLKQIVSTTVFGTTSWCKCCFGQILVTTEKFLILHIVVFMPLEIAKQLLLIQHHTWINLSIMLCVIPNIRFWALAMRSYGKTKEITIGFNVITTVCRKRFKNKNPPLAT